MAGELSEALEARLAPATTVHGVLVDVYGLGVLIQGEAGIGKSECALELLKRGHILVADDVVQVQHRRGAYLRGSCPEPLKNHMEVRGLGVIDVKLLFGIGAILDRTRIELAIKLEPWSAQATVDRTGLETRKITILDVEVPLIRIPVSPGRNLAVLIEVAALNQRLRSQGLLLRRDVQQAPHRPHERQGARVSRRPPGAEKKRVFVITGVSGAGKSQALKVFEDFGWFCVDNLPIALIDDFARLVAEVPDDDARRARHGRARGTPARRCCRRCSRR